MRTDKTFLKNKVEGLDLTDTATYFKVQLNKSVWYQPSDRELGNKPHFHGHSYITEVRLPVKTWQLVN